MNKLDEFKTEIVSRDPDIIGITETWGHKDVFDSEIVNDDYNFYRKDRVGRKGGEVALLVKKIFKSSSIQQNTDIEAVWCRVSLDDGSSLKVGVIYRSD